MERINEVTSKPIDVTADTEMSGISSGTITVHANARFILTGIGSGDLVVLAGGAADVRGILDGTLEVREGGFAQIGGMFSGTVAANEGELWIRAGSYLGERQVHPNGELGDPIPTRVSSDAPQFLLRGTYAGVHVDQSTAH